MQLYQTLVLSTLFLTTLASPAPANPQAPEKRTATTVYNDAQVIDADIRRLTADCNAITGAAVTASQFVKVIQDLNTALRDIKTAQTDCQNTVASTVTTAQAQQLINYYTSPLEPDSRVHANCFISKRSAFNAQGLVPVMLQEWKYLKGNFTILDNCVLSKIPATPTTLRPSATSVVNKLNSDLASLVAAYS